MPSDCRHQSGGFCYTGYPIAETAVSCEFATWQTALIRWASPWPGNLAAESTEKSRDGVRRTAEFAHVCRRSLKTEEREPKASTGDDGLI
jgi:hypothetical protein